MALEIVDKDIVQEEDNLELVVAMAPAGQVEDMDRVSRVDKELALEPELAMEPELVRS